MRSGFLNPTDIKKNRKEVIQFHMNLSIAEKLTVAFTFVSLLIILIGCLGLQGIYKVTEIELARHEMNKAETNIKDLQLIAVAQIDSGAQFLLFRDRQEILDFKKHGEQFKKELAMLTTRMPDFQPLFEKIDETHCALDETFYRLAKEYPAIWASKEDMIRSMHETYASAKMKLVYSITDLRDALPSEHTPVHQGTIHNNTMKYVFGTALLAFLVANFVGTCLTRRVLDTIVILKTNGGKISNRHPKARKKTGWSFWRPDLPEIRSTQNSET